VLLGEQQAFPGPPIVAVSGQSGTLDQAEQTDQSQHWETEMSKLIQLALLGGLVLSHTSGAEAKPSVKFKSTCHQLGTC
jgi:hypothetical protein